VSMFRSLLYGIFRSYVQMGEIVKYSGILSADARRYTLEYLPSPASESGLPHTSVPECKPSPSSLLT
jgi:hypothetical protein